jgi:hypothetical protein
MKISEILSNLDLSTKEKYYIRNEFLEEFGFSEHEVDTDKIELFRIRLTTWYCTDSWVGVSVILLGDTPICICNQVGRKWNEEYKWVNKELYSKVKVIVEQAKYPEPEREIESLDLNEEFGDSYQIEFASQLIYDFHTSAIFNGEKVYIKKIKEPYGSSRVNITFEDGREQNALLTYLEFPISGLKL